MFNDSMATYAAMASVSITAVCCLLLVWNLKNKHEIFSNWGFGILIGVGPFSWIAQIAIIDLIIFTERTALVLTICLLMAFLLFVTVIWLLKKKLISHRDGTQAILWGELVFPLVLVSLLPEGFHTLLNLL